MEIEVLAINADSLPVVGKPFGKAVAELVVRSARLQGRKHRLRAFSKRLDVGEEAHADEIAVDRDAPNGVLVLQLARRAVVDVEKGDAIFFPDIIGAKLADFLQPHAAEQGDERYPEFLVPDDLRPRLRAAACGQAPRPDGRAEQNREFRIGPLVPLIDSPLHRSEFEAGEDVFRCLAGGDGLAPHGGKSGEMTLDGLLRQQRLFLAIRQLFMGADDLVGREVLVGGSLAVIGRQTLRRYAELSGIRPRILAYRLVPANLDEKPVRGIGLVTGLLFPFFAPELAFDVNRIDRRKTRLRLHIRLPRRHGSRRYRACLRQGLAQELAFRFIVEVAFIASFQCFREIDASAVNRFLALMAFFLVKRGPGQAGHLGSDLRCPKAGIERVSAKGFPRLFCNVGPEFGACGTRIFFEIRAGSAAGVLPCQNMVVELLCEAGDFVVGKHGICAGSLEKFFGEPI